ncbi:MAG: LptF/LptG family permease [Kiritimatiellia bacterium]|jgi:lipopolysaccharide export system permease protein
MRILSRHVLREFLVPVAYCFVGFASIYLLFDFFDKQPKIAAAHPPAKTLVLYFLGYLSPVLEWMLPASLLLGALYATWQLSRHSEIIAMKASGVSFRSIATPMLLASVVLGVLSALNNEFIAPKAVVFTRRLADNKFHPLPPYLYENLPYNNEAAGRVWRIGSFDVNHPETIHDVTIDFFGEPGATPAASLGTNIATRVKTASLVSTNASYYDGCWWFHDAKLTFFNEKGEIDTTRPQPPVRPLESRPEFNEQPRDFALEANMLNAGALKLENAFSLRDLRRYLEMRPNLAPAVVADYRCDIWNRLASPWACLVITLFAVPAGVASGRQSVFKGVLVAVGLFFGFYAATQVCSYFGKRGTIPVPVSAWAPNVVFFLAGLHLFRKQSQ